MDIVPSGGDFFTQNKSNTERNWEQLVTETKATRLQAKIIQEMSKESLIKIKAIPLYFMLFELTKCNNQLTSLQKNLVNSIQSFNGGCFGGLKHKALHQAHLNLNSELDRRELSRSAETRSLERKAKIRAEKLTGRKFFHSFWFGPHQADVFSPYFRFNNTQGLVIEVNGGIHFEETKMKKDLEKYFCLENVFGILIKHFENKEVSSVHFRSVLAGLKYEKQPEHRGRKTQLNHSACFTLAHWACSPRNQKFAKDSICALLNLTWKQVEALLEICKHSESVNKILRTATSNLNILSKDKN
jgi:very-short-patch-repair endonuclease